MIVGVYGKSCSGKTVLSKSLHEQLSIDVRHCGEIVKALAAERGVSPAELTLEDHQRIDEATREIARASTALIIEGCFLDLVLVGEELLLVELRCSDEVRQLRYRERNSSMSFADREQSDSHLKGILYGKQTGSAPVLMIDTTNLRTDETVTEVRKWLQAQGL